MKKISVRFKKKKCPIFIGSNLFENKNVVSYFETNNKTLIITTKKIKNLWLKYFLSYFKKYHKKISVLILEEGEKNKIFNSSNKIITYLLKNNYGRDSILIAFGGGIVGDIVGFTASIYQRGISFIQIPTTLLAQVDASIGGKNGVNHILGKNMIGTFWQPQCVLINLKFLSTLSKREYLSGFSEIIKVAIGFDKNFFLYIVKNIKKIISLDCKVIKKCVLKACKIKANVVELDEFELGKKRALLNLGHTYGHAIESYTKYKEFLHGEAIAIGMIMSAKTSFLLKKISIKNYFLIKETIYNIGLPNKLEYKLCKKKFLNYMFRDKKNLFGKIRLILPISIGKAKIVTNISNKIIENVISYISK